MHRLLTASLVLALVAVIVVADAKQEPTALTT